MIIVRVQRASVKRAMASWFSRKPPAQLGPPWAVPEQALFDDDEDPAARLLRRRVRWEVIDEPRNARITGQEAFLSLSVLRLSSDGGVGARVLVEDAKCVQQVAAALRERLESDGGGFVVGAIGLGFFPTQPVELADDEEVEAVGALLDALEDHPDVQEVYHNVIGRSTE